MPEPEAENKRRSSRLFKRIPVVISGRGLSGRKFKQAVETIVVNAHGALLYLDESVEMDAEVSVTNPVTQEEQECRVVFLGETTEKGQRVGIEFLQPAPHFWGVEFPPDWTPPQTPQPSAPN
jgi:hypothetical protein